MYFTHTEKKQLVAVGFCLVSLALAYWNLKAAFALLMIVTIISILNIKSVGYW